MKAITRAKHMDTQLFGGGGGGGGIWGGGGGGGGSGNLRVERLENRDLIPIKGWRFFTPSPHSNSLYRPSNFSFKNYRVNFPRVQRPGYETVH